MVVTIHLHTILQRQTPDGLVRKLKMDLPEGSRLLDVLQILDVKLSGEDLLLVVNGRMAEEDQLLQEGDEVNLIPALSGGAL